MAHVLFFLIVSFSYTASAQVLIPIAYWGPHVWIDPNDPIISSKCPSTPAGTLSLVLNFKSNFQPLVCNVTAQDSNLTGVPLCLCSGGACQVTGLKVVNSFWTSDTAGTDTTLSGAITFNVGITQSMSATVAVPIRFLTGTWSPSCLGTSISAWYDASVGASVRTGAGGAAQAPNNSPVSVWQDQSGNGRNATQTTGADQALFRSNANASGYPGIQFVSNDFFNLPSTTLTGASSNYTFIVSQNNSSGNWARYFDFGSSTTSNYFSTPTNGTNSRSRITISGGGGEQGVSNGTSINNTRTLLMFEHTGSAISIYRDSTTTGTANVATTILPSAIGNTSNYLDKSHYADQYFLGWFQEVLIVNSTITAGERIVLEGYQAAKWGLQGVLPGAHKYKASAP